MEEDWLVIADSTLDRRVVETYGPVIWESALVPCLVVRMSARQAARLRRVRGVIRLEPPCMGSGTDTTVPEHNEEDAS